MTANGETPTFHVRIREPFFQWVPISKLEAGGIWKRGKHFQGGWGTAEIGSSGITVRGKARKPAVVTALIGWWAAGSDTEARKYIAFDRIKAVEVRGNTVAIAHRAQHGHRVRRIFLKPYAKKGLLGGSGRQAKAFAEALRERLGADLPAGRVRSVWLPRLAIGVVALGIALYCAGQVIYARWEREARSRQPRGPESVMSNPDYSRERRIRELEFYLNWPNKPAYRAQAATALATLEATESVPRLAEAVERYCDAEACAALRALAPKRLPSCLIEASHGADEVFERACQQMAGQTDSDTASRLIEILDCRHPPSRDAALRALETRVAAGSLGLDRQLDALSMQLWSAVSVDSGPDREEFRLAALELLGRTGRSGLRYLDRLRRHRDPAIAERASELWEKAQDGK